MHTLKLWNLCKLLRMQTHLFAGMLVVLVRIHGAYVPIDGHTDENDGTLLGQRPAQQGLQYVCSNVFGNGA